MKKIISILMLVFLLCFSLSACNFRKNEEKTEKNITVKVIWEENEKEINLSTNEKYLGEVLKKENIIKGEQGQYGLFVKSVNGIEANAEIEQWWCFTKGDEPIMTGVDLIEIADGDLFKITLKEGY